MYFNIDSQDILAVVEPADAASTPAEQNKNTAKRSPQKQMEVHKSAHKAKEKCTCQKVVYS